MSSNAKRNPKSRKVAQLEQQIRGLAAELLLQHELNRLRREIERLDERCEFIEHVHGPRSRQYRAVAMERETLLLRADQIITQWVEKHVSVASIKA